jgi:hypothetical protein
MDEMANVITPRAAAVSATPTSSGGASAMSGLVAQRLDKRGNWTSLDRYGGPDTEAAMNGLIPRLPATVELSGIPVIHFQ